MTKHVSIVLPIFNEETNLLLIYSDLTKIMHSLAQMYTYEIVFINDGSRDNSWVIIQDIAASDPHIAALSFSRNFGHQMALTAGYDIAQGDAVITMDADMQDTPALIFEMLKQWELGSDIVYARRVDRKDSFLKRITAQWYYAFLDHIADVQIPRNVGDFRLIDKKVLAALKKCHEKARYLRGMVAWTGFKHSFVDFQRPNRAHGITGYTWQKMFKLAFDGLTGFSIFPLKVAAYIGCFVIISGTSMFIYITLDALFHDVFYPLFKWLVTIIYIFMGVQFILLWFLGEYIGRTYEQQKNRPLYIVDEVINVKQ